MSGGLTLARRISPLALIAVLAALMPAGASAVSFFRSDVTVGTHPNSVAVGNFNGGAPDLAVADEGSSAVTILLGNGFGQFTPAGTVATGGLPSSVVVGNFNADSFADLAIASVSDDNIAIKLGDGNGGFTGTGTVSTGTSSDPRAIAVGDFNNDAKMDLVSANQGSSTVSIHLGDGMGAFAPDTTPCTSLCAAAKNPVAIATGKFDDIPVGTVDPDLDAIIASQTDDQVLVLMGDGTGEINGNSTTYTMGASMTDPNPSAVAVGSLNPSFNSEPDLLVANQNPDQVWPGFGILGGSGFQYGGVLATGADPVGVAFGDLDGDGDQDGISANRGGDTATAILSDGGGGTAVDTSSPVGSSPRAVATGAFDSDGKADAVVANYDSNSVTLLTSLAPGAPPGPPPGISNPPALKKKKCKKKKKHRAAAAKKKCKKKKR
jgi:hypothetical protein